MLDKAYEKCKRELKKKKTQTILFLFPLWHQNETVQRVIQEAKNEILILPDLKNEVFINTERLTNKKAVPSWQCAATVLEAANKPKRGINNTALKEWCTRAPQEKYWKLTPAAEVANATEETVVFQLDSGASTHVFANRRLFNKLRPSNTQVSIANGELVKVEGEGSVTLNLKSLDKKKHQTHPYQLSPRT